MERIELKPEFKNVILSSNTVLTSNIRPTTPIVPNSIVLNPKEATPIASTPIASTPIASAPVAPTPIVLNPEKQKDLSIIMADQLIHNTQPIETPQKNEIEMYVKPLLQESTSNNPFTGAQSVKVLSPAKVNITSQVFSNDGLPLENANVYVEGVAVVGTSTSGKFTLKNIPENAEIKVSYVGFSEVYFQASQVPEKIILTSGYELGGVEIKNNYKKNKSSLLWILLIIGVITYGGYRYSLNKDKKIVRTKI